MNDNGPRYLNVEQCVDAILEEFGQDLRFCMPLGLGKPIPLINALYQRARREPAIRLTIFTALSLEKPSWSNELERRFLEPFVQRVWGGIPDLEFMLDLRKGALPANVRIHEIFFKAGAYHGHPAMQQDYISSNYTHVVRDCAINGGDIFAHMIARTSVDTARCYSASCNADTSMQTLREYGAAQQAGKKRLRIGMVNSELPFMYRRCRAGTGHVRHHHRYAR